MAVRAARAVTVLLVAGALYGSVAGCGAATDRGSSTPHTGTGSEGEPAPVGGAPTPTVDLAPDATVVSVGFERGRLARKSDQVTIERGSTLVLAVTTDIANEIHLHGYDRLVPTRPGAEAVLQVTADRSGVFTAELERGPVALIEITVS